MAHVKATKHATEAAAISLDAAAAALFTCPPTVMQHDQGPTAMVVFRSIVRALLGVRTQVTTFLRRLLTRPVRFRIGPPHNFSRYVADLVPLQQWLRVERAE